MNESAIAEFAHRELEPIESVDGGPAFRCAAHLNDGVYLPCVLIAGVNARTTLAKSRFEETRLDALRPERDRRFGRGMTYDDIVRTFVATGNRVNSYDIARLERSRFAIPLARLREVRGETSMSWTQFTVVMHDGREFTFGTTYLREFFAMPDGYSGDDIATIRPASLGARPAGECFRERPFFTCYVDGL
jgi:hypothetical protein